MIGKNSIVSEDVEIGEGSRIWHFCNLYGCRIGNNTQIGSYCEIKQDAQVGDDCRFQSYVFVPEGTRIGNRVFVGPRVTFLNDRHPTSEKAIAGNWRLEAVVVEDDVSIGGAVTILPGVKIGKGAVIGAGSLVTKDIPEYGVAIGNPARVIGDSRDKKYSGYRVEGS